MSSDDAVDDGTRAGYGAATADGPADGPDGTVAEATVTEAIVADGIVTHDAAGDDTTDDTDGAPTDDTDGEDALHRSAVDAVDGLLDEVERALSRLDDGTYGHCELCGEAIDDDRLAGRPTASTCGPCGDPESVAAPIGS